jgi:gas vesicle protein
MADKKSEGISPVTAGVVGAVVGAAVGAVGTVLVKDEKSMKKMGKIVSSIKEQGTGMVDYAMESASSVQNKIGAGSSEKKTSKPKAKK